MKRLMSEVSWATGAQLINAFIALGTLKVWAEYLPPRELGLMALVITSASILAGIVLEPLGRATLLKYTSFADLGEKSQFITAAANTFSLVTALTLTAVLVLSLLTIAFQRFDWTISFFLAGFFLIDSIRFFSQTILTCERNQKAVAAITIVDASLRATLLWVAVATFGGCSEIALAGNMAGATLAAIFSTFQCRHHLLRLSPSQLIFDPRSSKRLKLIFHHAIPVAPANLLSHLSEATSRYIIASTLGLHHAGLFVATYGMVRRPYGMLADIGRTVMMPAYIEAVTRNQETLVRRLRFLWLTLVLGGSALGTLFLHFFRSELVEFLLSPDYASAATYLTSIALSVLILNTNTVLSGMLMSNGDTTSLLVGNGVATAVIVALTGFMASTLGFQGAIIAMGLGYLGQFLYLLARSLRGHRRAGRSHTYTQ